MSCRFDKMVGEGPFVAGAKVSVADSRQTLVADLWLISFVNMYRAPSFLDGFPADTLKPYPNIWALKERVANLPPLAQYSKECLRIEDVD
eukprot:gene23901-biopygen88704